MEINFDVFTLATEYTLNCGETTYSFTTPEGKFLYFIILLFTICYLLFFLQKACENNGGSNDNANNNTENTEDNNSNSNDSISD